MPHSLTRLIASLFFLGAGVHAHSADYRRSHSSSSAAALPPPPPPPPCPLDPSINVVYYSSTDGGVGVASAMWIEDFLSWWAAHDSTIHYRALSWQDVQTCNFNDYADTLRLYINPGGWATDQLYYYGLPGVNNIISWMKNQYSASHTYVGICAGGYLAAHDYTWETEYMPPEYFIEEVGSPPPLNLFPHTVEGSIVDIGDDEYGDYENNYAVRYRMVNVTDVSPATLVKDDDENGASVGDVYNMLYYGGSTYGWNSLPDYAQLSYNCSKKIDDSSNKTESVNCRIVHGTEADSLTVPLLLYTDLYGYNSPNIPAMWQYGEHIILSSIHPAADESVCVDDCPPLGTLTPEQIEANRLYFATQVNRVMAHPFKLPTPSAAVKNYKDKKQLKAAPHVDYPVSACYTKSDDAVFCDDFNVPPSVSVYPGMFQWQRNQTLYDFARPWNTTFTGTMCSGNGGPNYYGEGVDGSKDGWAVAIPYPNTDDVALSSNNTNSSRTHKSWPHAVKVNLTYGPVTTTIISEPIVFSSSSPYLIDLSYFYKGVTLPDGFFAVDYTCNGGWIWNPIRSAAIDTFPPPPPASSQALYTSHRHHDMSKMHQTYRPTFAWVKESWKFVLPETCGSSGFPLQIRFSCFAGAWATFDHFCGVDSVGVFSL